MKQNFAEFSDKYKQQALTFSKLAQCVCTQTDLAYSSKLVDVRYTLGGNNQFIGSIDNTYHHIFDKDKWPVKLYIMKQNSHVYSMYVFIQVTSKREDLLAHPLVTALLRHKWTKFGRVFYYVNFFIYAVFLTFLTGYITSTVPPYQM